MEPSLRILFPSTPGGLGAVHPAWEADVSVLGPWVEGAGAFVAAPDQMPSPCSDVVILEECASTMDEAWKHLASGGLGAWGSVLCARQSGGRGQLRRAWIAPPGNLSVSLVLPTLPKRLGDMASLLLGHAVSEALERETDAPILVKWPNDLLTRDGKVGGILVEERAGRMVAGIGLNLFAAPPLSALREEHAAPAAALPTLPDSIGPLRLWLRLLGAVRQEVERLAADDSSATLQHLLAKRLAYTGQRVRILDGAERFEARLLGIAEDGGLVVETFGREGGVSTLYSGCVFPL